MCKTGIRVFIIQVLMLVDYHIYLLYQLISLIVFFPSNNNKWLFSLMKLNFLLMKDTN